MPGPRQLSRYADVQEGPRHGHFTLSAHGLKHYVSAEHEPGSQVPGASPKEKIAAIIAPHLPGARLWQAHNEEATLSGRTGPNTLIDHFTVNHQHDNFGKEDLKDQRAKVTEAARAVQRALPDFKVTKPETTARRIAPGDTGIIYSHSFTAQRKPAAPAAEAESPAGAALRYRVEHDWENVKKEYEALKDTQHGRIVSVDEFREISPEYRADRSRAGEVHEACSLAAKKYFTEKLAQPTPSGFDPVVVFTSGGTGSGKSVSLQNLGRAEMVYDGNLQKMSSGDKRIQQALGAGRDVVVRHVARDPIESLVGATRDGNLFSGALQRAVRMGRPVPLDAHAATHLGAFPTALAIQAKYRNDPRVTVEWLDNTHGRGDARSLSPGVPLDQLPRFDYHNLRERLQVAWDTAYANRRSEEEFPDKIYRAGLIPYVDK